MIEFFRGTDLWSNIVGGVVAAILFAVLVYLTDRRKDQRKHRILSELTEIMGRAIEHRNKGESQTYADEQEWVRQAKKLEKQAVEKATELSTTAGSLVKWLDRTEQPWSADSEVEKYVSILSTVIRRIRELLERNS